MKKTFLKKIMHLLEKEVCQKESTSSMKYPLAQLTPMQLEKFKSIPLQNNITSSKFKETLLSEGVHVKGKLSFEHQLRIQGSFEGNLTAQGKVIVGPQGSIKGHLTVDEAEIYGSVIGNISVKKLTVGPQATISGDVKAQIITIHQGAHFSGFLEVNKTTAHYQKETLDDSETPPIHCLG